MSKKIVLFLVFLILVIKEHTKAQCAFGQSWTADPQPTNNTYQAGQAVNFCFTVGGFTQTSSNWMHGFVFNFGPGWDLSTLVVTQIPNSCSGNGYWQYFPSCSSTGSGQTSGPGVYFDYSTPFNPPDGNPGNNFGDQNLNNACTWVLCFKIQVASNCNSQNLNVGITVTGDGTTGSWGAGGTACAGTLNPGITGVNCTLPCDMELNFTSTNPGCANNNGEITVDISNGFAPFTYVWSNGETTQTVNGLGSGDYTVTVTDGTGCELANAHSIVNTDSSLTTVALLADIQCFSYCTGSLGAYPLIGIPPYTYNWSNGQTGQFIDNLCAGTYTVTMVDDNQCSSNFTFDLTQPSAPDYTLTATDASCYQSGDGTANINITTGNLPVNVIWQPSGQTAFNATFLTPNTYVVTLTDAIGCTLTDSVSISQPPKIKTDIAIVDVDCYGFSSGSITATPVIGIAPFTFLWNNGETSATISNLTSGVYSMTFTDANNCTADTSVIVQQPASMIINFDMQPASCEISEDGVLLAIPLGGTSPYQFIWSVNGNTNTVAGLNPGSYAVTVTDANSCSVADSTILVAEPTFTVDAGSDQSVVNGYTIDLMSYPSASGNYSYLWTPSNDIANPYIYNITVKPSETTTYTITIVNQDNGCTASDDVVVEVIPNPYLFIPTAFSPNGDGFNNTIFPIPGDGVTINSFRIYNRWGQMVHDSATKLAWDGTFNGNESPIGVYSYYCEYNTLDGVVSRKQGTFLLMR